MNDALVMLCIGGAVFAPAIGWQIAKRWPRSAAGKAAFMRQSFISKRRSEGLPLDKVMSEMARFETLARIRRRASDLVRRDYSTSEEAIRGIAKEELLTMAIGGNAAEAKAMAKAIDSFQVSDLLDPVVYGSWIHYRLAMLPAETRQDAGAMEDAISAYTGRI